MLARRRFTSSARCPASLYTGRTMVTSSVMQLSLTAPAGQSNYPGAAAELGRLGTLPPVTKLRADTPIGSTLRVWNEGRAWVAGGLTLVGVLAVSWWEILFLPLGDSHDGRIHGRFGLQIRNLFEDGLIGSSFGASMQPFTEQAYAHHPPLLNIVHAVIGSTLGRGEWQLHIVGFVAGLTTVVAMLWLARELGVGALASLGAVALMVGTPMFWIYARLGLGMSLGLVFLSLWARSRRIPGGWADRWVVAAAAVTAFSAWTGAALVLVVAGWGWRDPERRPIVTKVGMAGVAAVAVAVVWVLAATSMSELAEHTGNRFRSPVGLGEFVDQYRWFYTTLFPRWFRWLIPAAIVLALVDRSTRRAAVAMLVVSGAWTIGLPEAAFVHDYWTFPLLGPVALGLIVALQWVADQRIDRRVLAAALVVFAISSFASLQRGPIRDSYFRAPAQAGALVRSVDPPASQTVAWVAGPIDVPRWLSYYWDMPTGRVDEGSVQAVLEGDFVLIRLDRPLGWVGAPLVIEAQEGRYGIVTAGELRSRR